MFLRQEFSIYIETQDLASCFRSVFHIFPFLKKISLLYLLISNVLKKSFYHTVNVVNNITNK